MLWRLGIGESSIRMWHLMVGFFGGFRLFEAWAIDEVGCFRNWLEGRSVRLCGWDGGGRGTVSCSQLIENRRVRGECSVGRHICNLGLDAGRGGIEWRIRSIGSEQQTIRRFADTIWTYSCACRFGLVAGWLGLVIDKDRW